METEFISTVIKGLAATGLPSLLMGFAIWWLQKSNAGWITTLNAEREARIRDHETRICELQKRSDICEQDRMDLRQRLFEIMHNRREK